MAQPGPYGKCVMSWIRCIESDISFGEGSGRAGKAPELLPYLHGTDSNPTIGSLVVANLGSATSSSIALPPGSSSRVTTGQHIVGLTEEEFVGVPAGQDFHSPS